PHPGSGGVVGRAVPDVFWFPSSAWEPRSQSSASRVKPQSRALRRRVPKQSLGTRKRVVGRAVPDVRSIVEHHYVGHSPTYKTGPEILDMTRTLSLAVVLALLAGPAVAADAPAEKLPDGAKVAKLTVHPAKVELAGPFAYAQLLVTAHLENGDALDATRLAKVVVPKFVKVSPAGQVRPAADGSGKLTVTLAGQSVEVPVTASGQNVPPTVSFVPDVGPVLSKVGCDAGTCHGAAKGKAGFKLLLRGYAP